MKNFDKPLKLGLLGTTGVGKDTCVSLIRDYFPHRSINLVRLADPLYKAQEAIYRICKKNKEFYTQDGELLNFLGSHMRKINPDVLKQAFIDALQFCDAHADFIICPDVRPADIQFVRDVGFIIIHIYADQNITLERRMLRGDISLGKVDHETEKGLSSSMYDYRLTNNGSLQEFQENIGNLISRLTI